MANDLTPLFTWVPFLKELGLKILEYHDEQSLLIDLLREGGVKQGLDDRADGRQVPLEEIDPYTFASLIFKYGLDEKRARIFRHISSEMGIEADLPDDYTGVPKANAQSAWFFGYQDRRQPDDIDVLWEIARGAQNHSITPELWLRATKIYKSGRAKLTQGMFWYCPETHFPVDAQTTPYLHSKGINADVESWPEYQSLLHQVAEKIDKPYYQISHDAWASNQSNENPAYTTTLSAGAIRNGYIRITRGCKIFETRHYGGTDSNQMGDPFTLELPDGQTIETDIRRETTGHAGRLRSRFTSLFNSYSIEPGAKATIVKTGEDTYSLSFSGTPSTQNVIEINRPLLALAVERTIRPYLIDRDYLHENNLEGYQHSRIIPKAQPLLSRSSLESNPIDAVKGAIRVAHNLLSQYEHARPLPFLDQCDPSEARERFVDLLHGEDELGERVTRFSDWADWKKHSQDGNPIGFNATITSYLLCVSQPETYAFCKPENYQAAAKALLGPRGLEHSPYKRIGHAKQFYQAVLEILQDEHGLPFTDLMHVHIAFWMLKDWGDGVPSWDDLIRNETPKEPEIMKNLNTILYGPPGTGKTYQTAHLAVEIIDGEAPSDRAELMKRYHQLSDAGRISFVTFHQSFSYEEFVEGIRPVLASEEGNEAISYELRDGIFKQACQIAQGVRDTRTTNYQFEKGTKIWKISLGDSRNPDEAHIYDDCVEHNQIAVGFGGANDFSGCDDRTSITERLEKLGFELVKNDYTPTAINCFKNSVRIGDLVIVSDGNLKFRAIGKVIGDYEYDAEYIYPHVRKVEWLRVFEESLPYGQLIKSRFSQMTLYNLSERNIKIDALHDLLAPSPSAGQKSVIIIDEINRGNISKILGELITLLEDDKRLGATNQLKARLPYSGEEFGIPSNLYIIGTMNTADRSLAHLDTALRRRFKFAEVMPNETLLGTVEWDGKAVDIRQLLKAINRRIEALFDREHMIGHSYLMDGHGGTVDASNLPQVFEHKIIPLLTEYFFEDWSKVRAILGDDQVDDTDVQFVTAEDVDSNLSSLKSNKRKVFRFNREALENPGAYIKIYSASD